MKPPGLALYRRLIGDIKVRDGEPQHRADYAPHDIQKPSGIADYELTRALPKELASSLLSIEDIQTETREGLKEGSQ